jgi:hypothetical protein
MLGMVFMPTTDEPLAALQLLRARVSAIRASSLLWEMERSDDDHGELLSSTHRLRETQGVRLDEMREARRCAFARERHCRQWYSGAPAWARRRLTRWIRAQEAHLGLWADVREPFETGDSLGLRCDWATLDATRQKHPAGRWSETRRGTLRTDLEFADSAIPRREKRGLER